MGAQMWCFAINLVTAGDVANVLTLSVGVAFALRAIGTSARHSLQSWLGHSVFCNTHRCGGLGLWDCCHRCHRLTGDRRCNSRLWSWRCQRIRRHIADDPLLLRLLFDVLHCLGRQCDCLWYNGLCLRSLLLLLLLLLCCLLCLLWIFKKNQFIFWTRGSNVKFTCWACWALMWDCCWAFWWAWACCWAACCACCCWCACWRFVAWIGVSTLVPLNALAGMTCNHNQSLLIIINRYEVFEWIFNLEWNFLQSSNKIITWTLPRPGIFCTGMACKPDMFGIWMMFALAGRICCSACVGITVICWPCAFVMVMGCESGVLAMVWMALVAFGTDWTSAFEVPTKEMSYV